MKYALCLPVAAIMVILNSSNVVEKETYKER